MTTASRLFDHYRSLMKEATTYESLVKIRDVAIDFLPEYYGLIMALYYGLWWRIKTAYYLTAKQNQQ